MKDQLESSNELHNKKISKSRRRLHEAEVLSTTPCTAPVRRPQQDPSNHKSSKRGLGLDNNNQQLPSADSVTSSAGAAIDEYNRISNKTGGFEGALPLQYDSIFPSDDNTVQFDNTVKSSPEPRQKAIHQNMNGGRDVPHARRRLFQRQRRSSVGEGDKLFPRFGFLRMWNNAGTAGKDLNLSSSSFDPTTERAETQQNTSTEIRPPKLRLSSRGTTTVTMENNSDKSVSKHKLNVAASKATHAGLPMGSPRFILPDESPPDKTGTSRMKKGSDNTSAAVIARRSQSSQISDDQGFELSISSAPPAYSTPKKQQHQRRSTAPIDLDEVDGQSSSEESSGHNKQALVTVLHTRDHQNHSVTRPSSLSPIRQRKFQPSISPNQKKAAKSHSAHSRLGISFDSEDDISKFSADHLGALDPSEPLRHRRSPSERERIKGYNGLKRWILPSKRASVISIQEPPDGGHLPKTKNDPDKHDRQYQAALDEVQSLSPDQRESIFANMELVEKESSEYKRRRSKGTVKSTSYTQSTTSSSKDAPVMRLPLCVVCNFYDRSHIAVPCMHFAYCRECSMRLAKLGKGCVLCNNQQVTFAAVSV